MNKFITCVFLILHLGSSQAQTNKAQYQIDMIVFTHQASSQQPDDNIFFPSSTETMSLKKASKGNYTQLPIKASQLQNAYYALRRKPEYTVIAHYSWSTAANQPLKIVLAETVQANWKLGGTLGIKHNQYFQLDAKLVLSRTDQASQFLFEKIERLNANTTYYLDHPQAGMIIKIHQLS